MIIEKVVMKAGVFTAAASLVGTNELTQHLPLFERAEELTIGMWAIGGFLGVIAVLISALCKIAWDIRTDNRKDHAELFKNHSDIRSKVSSLQGEHDAAFNLRGCAYEPTRFREVLKALIDPAIDDAVEKALERRRLARRHEPGRRETNGDNHE